MSITVEGMLGGEFQVNLTDGDTMEDGSVNTLTVHPWERKNGHYNPPVFDREVYLGIGYRMPDGEFVESEDTPYANIIVNKDDFIESILAVFPELTRKEDK